MRSSAALATVVLALFAGPLHGQSETDARRRASLESLLQLEVSTAARHAQTASQAPASVSVITSEDLERYGDRTLSDVLQRLRGFYISYDRNYTYVGARGFSRPTDYNNRVLLLLDGIPLNEGVYGAAPVGAELSLNLEALERIEVVRGPASALYGTGAMLAVVNLITKKGSDVHGLTIMAEGGSAHTSRAGLTMGRTFAQGLDVLVSGSATRTDGMDLHFPEFDSPETNAGVAVGRDWGESGNALAVVRYGDVSLRAFGSTREKGIPTAAYTHVFNMPDASTKDAYTSVALGFSRWVRPERHVSGNLYFAQYVYSGSYPSDVANNDSTDGKHVGADAQLVWDLAPSHRLTAGGGFDRHARADYRAWYDGAPYFSGDFPYTNLSGYVQHEAALTSSVTLTLGIRHDRRSDADPTTSPRAALLYSPSERRTVKLLYGEAFREPSVYERHYEDGDFVAWPALGREHVTTLEAVWEERFGSWLRGEVSVFYYDISGLIDTTLDEDRGVLHFENLASVSAPGFEAELEARLPSGAAVYANYAHQRARDGRTDGLLTNSPSHLLKLGGGSPPSARLSAMAEVRWESDRATVYGGSTDAYALARTGLRYRPAVRLQTWVVVENLFDTRYATPGGYEHRQPSIQQDGRTLRAGLSYHF